MAPGSQMWHCIGFFGSAFSASVVSFFKYRILVQSMSSSVAGSF